MHQDIMRAESESYNDNDSDSVTIHNQIPLAAPLRPSNTEIFLQQPETFYEKINNIVGDLIEVAPFCIVVGIGLIHASTIIITLSQYTISLLLANESMD
jgi:hypothetical protein